MRNDKDNVIVTKTIDFSVSVITYCEALEQDKKYVIARQLLRSATSIGAKPMCSRDKMLKAKLILFIK